MATPSFDLTDYLAIRSAEFGPALGIPGRLKRLGDNEAGYMASNTSINLDRRKMIVRGVCTTEALDRSREIVRASGLNVADHKRNPVVTVGHQWRDPDGVIARAEIDGKYTVEPGAEGGKTPFAAQFFQSGPAAFRAEQAFGLIDSGVLRAVSIGFLIRPDGAQRFVAPDGFPALEITGCDLFEVTFVPVGDNPDAVVRVVEKGLGGRRLVPAYASLLAPLIPSRKAAVRGGYTREKVMPNPNDPADPNADPAADPAEAQDPPAAIGPPSAQLLSDFNTYLIGLLKFIKQATTTHESPVVEGLVPMLQLHLSQAFRANAQAYAQLQAKFPDIPTLPGAGSLLAAESDPSEEEDEDFDSELDFDDDFDESEFDPEADPEADPADPEADPDADPEEDDDPDERMKSLRVAMNARSERILDEFWKTFSRELDRTDAMRLKRASDLLAHAAKTMPVKARREARSLAGALREKALAHAPAVVEKAPAVPAQELANAIKARMDEELKPIKDGLYQVSGKAI